MSNVVFIMTVFPWVKTESRTLIASIFSLIAICPANKYQR